MIRARRRRRDDSSSDRRARRRDRGRRRALRATRALPLPGRSLRSRWVAPRTSRPVRNEATIVLGQRKLLQRLGPGLMHAFIFWGFLVLFPTIFMAIVAIVDREQSLPADRRSAGSRAKGWYAFSSTLRRTRARRRRDRVLHPQGAAPRASREPPGRGRPHPGTHRRNRDDAPPVARVAHRARPEPVAGRVVARLERGLRRLR